MWLARIIVLNQNPVVCQNTIEPFRGADDVGANDVSRASDVVHGDNAVEPVDGSARSIATPRPPRPRPLPPS